MEMHQVRYFLAVARVLNFTRAADECNVTQPSLTRAIKQLEAELGGDLFRRERPAAQLTELGQRMHPLLRQCYEAANGARELASSFKSGEVGALRIALTHSVDLSLLIPHLCQVKRLFNRLEFRFLRGNSREVAEFLKKGEAELGIAAEISEEWDRLAIPGRCSPKTSSSSSTAIIRWRHTRRSISAIFAPNNCCREIIANMRRA
jgi:DNA-binding transcriptional LysR family regulator